MKPYSKYCKLLALAAGVSLAVPASSRAAVVLTLQQVGSDVVLSMDAGGSINTNLLDLGSNAVPATPLSGVIASIPLSSTASFVAVVLGSGSSYDVFPFLPSAISGPTYFGTTINPAISASSNTGPYFGIVFQTGGGGGIVLPAGYSSGAPLGAASSTFAGRSLASLGITPGTYVWTIGTGPNTDTVTMNVVPESASLLVPATAVATLGLVQVRRRSRRA